MCRGWARLHVDLQAKQPQQLKRPQQLKGHQVNADYHFLRTNLRLRSRAAIQHSWLLLLVTAVKQSPGF